MYLPRWPLTFFFSFFKQQQQQQNPLFLVDLPEMLPHKKTAVKADQFVPIGSTEVNSSPVSPGYWASQPEPPANPSDGEQIGGRADGAEEERGVRTVDLSEKNKKRVHLRGGRSRMQRRTEGGSEGWRRGGGKREWVTEECTCSRSSLLYCCCSFFREMRRSSSSFGLSCSNARPFVMSRGVGGADVRPLVPLQTEGWVWRGL